tara:strand:- start:537 stop:809 length:273 start_codon:yes stop_codon:yes gene_type:complete
MTDVTHEDILAQLAQVEKNLADELTELTKQTKAQGSFIFGGPKGPGLAELVRQHEAWIAIQRRLILVLVPAIFLGVGAVVWQAVTASIAK